MDTKQNQKKLGLMLSSLLQQSRGDVVTRGNSTPVQYNSTESAMELVEVLNPDYGRQDERRIVTMLSSVLGDGLVSYRVLRQYGRIFIVQFDPVHVSDPILPFCLSSVDKSDEYSLKVSYFTLSNALSDLPNFDYRDVRKAADRLVGIVGKYANQLEFNYFAEALYYIISSPIGSQKTEEWT